MVNDLFVDFNEFISQVSKIEGAPIKYFLNEWSLELYKLDNPIVHWYFLPYPYHYNYISEIINWQNQFEDVQNKYLNWFEQIYKNSQDDDIRLEYNNAVFPLICSDSSKQAFTWDNFFKDRLIPFIDSAITEEDYDKYSDCQVLIGIDRNNHAIVKPDNYGKLLKGFPEVENKIEVNLFKPSTEKYYYQYSDSNYVILGDASYGLQPYEVLKSMGKLTGNIYLFDRDHIG